MMPGGLDVQARILSPIGEALYHWLHLGRYLRLQSLDNLLDQEVGLSSEVSSLIWSGLRRALSISLHTQTAVSRGSR